MLNIVYKWALKNSLRVESYKGILELKFMENCAVILSAGQYFHKGFGNSCQWYV